MIFRLQISDLESPQSRLASYRRHWLCNGLPRSAYKPAHKSKSGSRSPVGNGSSLQPETKNPRTYMNGAPIVLEQAVKSPPVDEQTAALLQISSDLEAIFTALKEINEPLVRIANCLGGLPKEIGHINMSLQRMGV